MNYLATNLRNKWVVGGWLLLSLLQVLDAASTQVAVLSQLATEANPLLAPAVNAGLWEALWISKFLLIIAMTFPMRSKWALWYYVCGNLLMLPVVARSLYYIVLAWKAGLIS